MIAWLSLKIIESFGKKKASASLAASFDHLVGAGE
jgi:hypothetical protein